MNGPELKKLLSMHRDGEAEANSTPSTTSNRSARMCRCGSSGRVTSPKRCRRGIGLWDVFWEGEVKCRACIYLPFSPGAPAVAANDTAHIGQSNSGALKFLIC